MATDPRRPLELTDQSVQSLRFFQSGTTTDSFVEVAMTSAPSNGFGSATGTIDVQNTSANDMDLSFDGTNVQGRVTANSTKTFRNRHEKTMHVKSTVGGSAATFLIHAW